MKHTSPIVGLLLLLNALLPLTPVYADEPPPAFEWMDNLDAARAEALRTKKPLLIVFRCVP